MTPEERAMQLLYEGYIPENQPVVRDTILQEIDRIGSYTHHILKDQQTPLEPSQVNDLRFLKNETRKMRQLWTTKPPLVTLTQDQKNALHHNMRSLLNAIIGISTLLLADSDLLSSRQEMHVQTINDTGYQLLEILREMLS